MSCSGTSRHRCAFYFYDIVVGGTNSQCATYVQIMEYDILIHITISQQWQQCVGGHTWKNNNDAHFYAKTWTLRRVAVLCQNAPQWIIGRTDKSPMTLRILPKFPIVQRETDILHWNERQLALSKLHFHLDGATNCNRSIIEFARRERFVRTIFDSNKIWRHTTTISLACNLLSFLKTIVSCDIHCIIIIITVRRHTLAEKLEGPVVAITVRNKRTLTGETWFEFRRHRFISRKRKWPSVSSKRQIVIMHQALPPFLFFSPTVPFRDLSRQAEEAKHACIAQTNTAANDLITAHFNVIICKCAIFFYCTLCDATVWGFWCENSNNNNNKANANEAGLSTCGRWGWKLILALDCLNLKPITEDESKLSPRLK